MSFLSNSSHRILAFAIFSSRWLQAPLYLGLIFVQCIYLYQFLKELHQLFNEISKMGEDDIMLVALGLIDVVMISNLLIMVIIGGYETFVSRLRMDRHPDSPEWLSQVNANTMKIKLALALIGISSIHLLKTFINLHKIPDREVLWQVIIHTVFLFSAFFLAYTSKLAQDISHSPGD
ncbi:TIGR00645 family protein [Candidatus Odyssella thessalonicensis]|uniref:TIGR00645 family protein n=1 Tax=Candidatus Odyssella thessalonicensis TaxID=84647 RepID=UPI000225BD88|nr:TIGR00645 family protein [Candidatus Odyssella thessalonicensis]